MLRAILLVIASLFVVLPVVAQDAYPSRAVKLVVPFPAGGPLDVLARILAQKLTVLWDKPVIVDNTAGATGSIGANAVARAEPDGYTLLVTVDIPLTMFPAVAKKLPYDPRTDFTPIANVARTVNALFVNAAVKANTVAEVVALAKAQPGKLTFSSAGIASPAHFAGELFKVIAGIDMTHIPYKGAAPAMAAAVSGEVNLMFGPITQGMPHLKSGRLRVLGITGSEPSALLPGVKPLVDQGFDGLVVTNWYPIMAPARTPEPVIATIAAGLKRVIGDPEVVARLTAMGTIPTWQDAEQVTRAIDADLKRWGDLARRAKIQTN